MTFGRGVPPPPFFYLRSSPIRERPLGRELGEVPFDALGEAYFRSTYL